MLGAMPIGNPPLLLKTHGKRCWRLWRRAYTGLQASDFSEEDFDFAQQHLRDASGLYGLLQPC
jgi:cytoplasmic iron level regulating protein YaaA (DUF328/UPF0246 family)